MNNNKSKLPEICDNCLWCYEEYDGTEPTGKLLCGFDVFKNKSEYFKIVKPNDTCNRFEFNE